MTDTQALATTENLLHPRQASELSETRAKLQGVLGEPAYVRAQLKDGGAHVQKQIRDLDQLLGQAPKPYAPDELDAAVKLEETLRETWLEGMPTQAEMRRNPAGAVDKNVAWDRRSKQDVLRWKHLKRRLHASGISEHRLADEGDISNIEKYRPAGGSQEMNMHNEQIPGKIVKLPPPGAAPATVMTAEDQATLKEVNPELLDRMCTLDNDQRAEVLDLVRSYSAMSKPKRQKKAKGPLTEKQIASRAAASVRMKAMHVAKKAAKLAAGG